MRRIVPSLSVMFILSACEPLVYRAGHSNPDHDAPEQTHEQRFLLQIAARRPAEPIQGIMNGELVVADYTSAGSGDCGTVLVTYQDLNYSETWNVCREGTVSQGPEDRAQLLNNPDFIAVRHAATQTAWRFGQSQAVFAGYDIFARTLGSADARGCVAVENTVSRNDVALDTRRDQVCGND